MTRPKVFVSAAADMTHVAYAMREMLSPDADVFMLKESPSQGRTILESILAAVDRADLAVVLLSADTSFHPRSRSPTIHRR